MKTMINCFTLGFVWLVSVFVFTVSAQAILDFDITFDSGSEPADFGFG